MMKGFCLSQNPTHSLLTPYNTVLCFLSFRFDAFMSCEWEWCHRWEQTKIRGCPVGHSKGNSIEIKGLVRIEALCCYERCYLQLLVVLLSLLYILQVATAEEWLNPPVHLQRKEEAPTFKMNDCQSPFVTAQHLI